LEKFNFKTVFRAKAIVKENPGYIDHSNDSENNIISVPYLNSVFIEKA